jgi:hypothetical protein
MTPDAIDITLIFAFVICVIVLGGISALRSAYRAGYFHGKRQGRIEARLNQAIEKVDEEWERRLDV